MTLTWVASALPNASRNAAAKISPESLNWVRNELPYKYAAQLLKVGMTSREIEDEVLRLKKLPKNKRQPWQSEGSYAVSRFVSVCKWIGIVVLTLALIVVMLRLYWYFFGINAVRKPVTFEPYGQEFREKDRVLSGKE